MAATNARYDDGSRKEDDFVDIKAVRQEFRVIEDAALAQKLQDEEFQSHYIRNRKDRGTARIDVKAAKKAYLEEVKQAGILTKSELESLSNDAVWLAAELKKHVEEEAELERQHKEASEHEDAELARRLQIQERDRVEEARRQRLERRFHKIPEETPPDFERDVRGSERVLLPPEEDSRAQRSVEVELYAQQASSAIPKSQRDVGDVDKQYRRHRNSPPEERRADVAVAGIEHDGDFEEARRLQQEIHDEEYAMRLQLAEERRQRRIIEERDRRLAIKMQRKEAEEYRRKKAELEQKRAAESNPAGQEDTIDGFTMPTTVAVSDENQAQNFEARESRVGSGRLESTPNVSADTSRERKTMDDTVNVTNESRDTQFAAKAERSSQNSKNGLVNSKGDWVSFENGSTAGYKDNKGNRAITDIDRPNLKSVEKGKENDVLQSWEPTSRSNSMESPRQYNNIAETIDPTFRSGYAENTSESVVSTTQVADPLPDERSVSPSSGRPVPVIQNVRRKKSVDEKKKRKGSEKCKQQ